MPILMTARYKVHRARVDHCKEAIRNLVTHVKNNEPKLKYYFAMQEVLDPASFFHLLVFEDEMGLKIHQASKASERFVNAIYPETLKPLEFAEYNIVSTNVDFPA